MVQLTDQKPETAELLKDVLAGLEKTQKELPCKLLYDERGSELYTRICELPEYYPARTETGIMRDRIHEIAEFMGPNCLLIEYGSGTSEKTRVLLDNLPQIAAYVPIDISKEHLVAAARDINEAYPALEVLPVCADYNNHIDLPKPSEPAARRVVFFPGSTIGNFEPEEAVRFMRRVAKICGAGDGLLVGVDLQKDKSVLELAYDDPTGVTSEFNLNILAHLNAEIGSDFDVSAFSHRAVYNEPFGRVEMHLVSETDQTVTIDENEIAVGEGETIWTESSYKYTRETFAAIAAEAGFEVQHVWTDDRDYFSVQFLTC